MQFSRMILFLVIDLRIRSLLPHFLYSKKLDTVLVQCGPNPLFQFKSKILFTVSTIDDVESQKRIL
jgi:hypothetical protein